MDHTLTSQMPKAPPSKKPCINPTALNPDTL